MKKYIYLDGHTEPLSRSINTCIALDCIEKIEIEDHNLGEVHKGNYHPFWKLTLYLSIKNNDYIYCFVKYPFFRGMIMEFLKNSESLLILESLCNGQHVDELMEIEENEKLSS